MDASGPGIKARCALLLERRKEGAP